MKKIKIVTVITLFLISLTGCKKSKEELEKELANQRKQEIEKAINSVYELGGGGHLARLVDPENYDRLEYACLDFGPKSGKGRIKFYKFPKYYEINIVPINEFEYILKYANNEARMKLEATGDFPVKEGSMSFFGASAQLTLPGDKNVYQIGRMDLIYGSDSVARSRHGRFKTLEECEAQISADEELSETLRKQDGACEGPGC
ncbi:lipoprotein, tandem type [Leptospira interrogans]|uniref:lipoprotein, tandem type n=1 Tax=Leptospira interrogans TaxID=173 RepID=UPI000774D447|nr:lipoprotein, tandem type [Leptospira interrogans]